MKPIRVPRLLVRPCALTWLLAGLLPSRADAPGASTASSPQILVPPRNQTVIAGEYARLEVIAAGSVPLFYQWQTVVTNVLTVTNTIDGHPVVTTSNQVVIANLEGATKSALILTALTTNQSKGYQVVITNVAGAQTSRVAALTVLPYTARELVLESYETPQAGRVTLPILFSAMGDERRLSASLAFAPTVLANPSVTLDPAWTNVTLTTDASEIGSGRLGLTFALPEGANALSGDLSLATVAFDLIGAGNMAQAALSWTSQPVSLQVLDATNAPLTLLCTIDPKVLPATDQPTFNPQSGLFTQSLLVLNPGAEEIRGARVWVNGLTNDSRGVRVLVQNAADQGVWETNILAPRLRPPNFDFGPLAGGALQPLTAEFYVSDRGGNTLNLWSLPLPTYAATVAQPTRLNPSIGAEVAVDSPRFVNSTFLVEFITLTNFFYYIQYNWTVDDTNSVWKTAVPAVVGTGARVQWIDNGPPKTESVPAGENRRFYRVVRQ